MKARVSLGVKMKRFNINLFIPSYKLIYIFDLSHAHIHSEHDETQQKEDWRNHFHKAENTIQNMMPRSLFI